MSNRKHTCPACKHERDCSGCDTQKEESLCNNCIDEHSNKIKNDMELKASTELNKEIALYLGYEICKHSPDKMWRNGGEIGVNAVFIPKYSSDMEAARELIEYLRHENFMVSVTSMPDNSKWLQMNEDRTWTKKPIVEKYQCSVTVFNEGFDSWIGFCDPLALTMPLAICRAFIMVMTHNPGNPDKWRE